MHKITYKEMAMNRPMIVQRGFPGFIEANCINAYAGEWVVFRLPMNDEETVFGEVRLPIDEALESGIIISADKLYNSMFEDEEEV